MDALRGIVRALRRSARATERRLGVSAAQLFVLHEVAADEGCSINTLAGRTLTHQSSVSLVVSALEARGLVARRAAEADRRRTAVVLTAAGRRVLARAPEVTQVRLLAALRRMPAADRTALAGLLGSLVRAIERTDAAPPMFFEDEPTVGRRTRRARQAGARLRRRAGEQYIGPNAFGR